jgi:hypothetical protein
VPWAQPIQAAIRSGSRVLMRRAESARARRLVVGWLNLEWVPQLVHGFITAVDRSLATFLDVDGRWRQERSEWVVVGGIHLVTLRRSGCARCVSVLRLSDPDH